MIEYYLLLGATNIELVSLISAMACLIGSFALRARRSIDAWLPAVVCGSAQTHRSVLKDIDALQTGGVDAITVRKRETSRPYVLKAPPEAWPGHDLCRPGGQAAAQVPCRHQLSVWTPLASVAYAARTAWKRKPSCFSIFTGLSRPTWGPLAWPLRRPPSACVHSLGRDDMQLRSTSTPISPIRSRAPIALRAKERRLLVYSPTRSSSLATDRRTGRRSTQTYAKRPGCPAASPPQHGVTIDNVTDIFASSTRASVILGSHEFQVDGNTDPVESKRSSAHDPCEVCGDDPPDVIPANAGIHRTPSHKRESGYPLSR